jgi:hypothetical protein
VGGGGSKMCLRNIWTAPLKDGANCLSTPLWGYLCDKKNRDSSVKHYLVLSAILVGVSFLLMGAGSVIMFDVTM